MEIARIKTFNPGKSQNKKSKLNNPKHQFNTPKRLIHNHVVSYCTFKRPKFRRNFSHWCPRPRCRLIPSYWETSGHRHLLLEIHSFSHRPISNFSVHNSRHYHHVKSTHLFKVKWTHNFFQKRKKRKEKPNGCFEARCIRPMK